MMRSLYSAISGLKNHQVKMDVIGNNTANVNTTGFKKSTVNFNTMLSQTLKGASAPTANQGGTNAIQVGLGAQLGSIDQMMGQGSAQSTGKATDMMLQGSGFFVLNNNGETAYTRAGGFGFDKEGYLVDPASGARVQGYTWGADDTTAPVWSGAGYGDLKIELGDPMPGTPTHELTSFSIDQTGVITGVYSDGNTSLTHKIGQIAVAKFPNDAGLTTVGGNFYAESNNSGTADVGAAGDSGRGTIVPGAVEMSNVDLAQEFTDMIVTQRGYQANSRIITVSDSLLQELIDLKRG